MKVATIGHLDNKNRLKQLPKSWIRKKMVVSPEYKFEGIKGYYFLALKLTAQQMMSLPKNKVQQQILNAALYAQNEFEVDLIQLGGLTTSVTKGGIWLTEQKEYSGLVNHGDSYTAAIACKAVLKILNLKNKEPSDLVLAIVGSYGIIGEAVSKILVPLFAHSILIGRREEKLQELRDKIEGSFETKTKLKTIDADIIVTATSHPTTLLKSEHLKEDAIIVDVSQPPNLAQDLCRKRSDICRIDGGYVDFSEEINMMKRPNNR